MDILTALHKWEKVDEECRIALELHQVIHEFKRLSQIGILCHIIVDVPTVCELDWHTLHLSWDKDNERLMIRESLAVSGETKDFCISEEEIAETIKGLDSRVFTERERSVVVVRVN